MLVMKLTPETSGFTFTFYSSDLPGEPQVTVIVKRKKLKKNLDGTHTKNAPKPIGLTSAVSIPGKQKMGSGGGVARGAKLYTALMQQYSNTMFYIDL